MKLFSLRFLRSRKFWQRSAFSLACLVTLIAAAYTIENHRGRSAWEHYRREAESRGTKIDLKHLIKHPIPDEENFAATPLLQELSSRDQKVADRASASVSMPVSVESRDHWYLSSRGQLVPDFTMWREEFIKAGFLDSASDDPATDILRALDRYEPALRELRQAALQKPKNRLNAGWEKGTNADIFHMRGTLHLGRILSLRASTLAALGRTPEALEDWRTLLRLCQMFEGDLILLTGMLRTIMLAYVTGPIQAGLVEKQWTAAQLHEMNNALEKIDLRQEFTSMLVGERIFSNTVFDDDRFMQPYASVPKGWLYQNRVRINRWYDRAIDASQSGVSLKALDREYVRQARSWWRWPYFFLVDTIMGSGLSDHQLVMTSAQAEISLARIACALELYRMRTGTHPEQLSVLIPTELKTLPNDPFTNTPFQYHPRPDGTYVLYSVGEDGQDNGADRMLDQVWSGYPASSQRK